MITPRAALWLTIDQFERDAGAELARQRATMQEHVEATAAFVTREDIMQRVFASFPELRPPDAPETIVLELVVPFRVFVDPADVLLAVQVDREAVWEQVQPSTWRGWAPEAA